MFYSRSLVLPVFPAYGFFYRHDAFQQPDSRKVHRNFSMDVPVFVHQQRSAQRDQRSRKDRLHIPDQRRRSRAADRKCFLWDPAIRYPRLFMWSASQPVYRHSVCRVRHIRFRFTLQDKRQYLKLLCFPIQKKQKMNAQKQQIFSKTYCFRAILCDDSFVILYNRFVMLQLNCSPLFFCRQYNKQAPQSQKSLNRISRLGQSELLSEIPLGSNGLRLS